ncbi:MAG TPA: tetratricopeptide repeat protein [Chloroflexota bacterium]|nr:tetratricopeptide repeat protein [Chloroflexota bacterium]HUM67384.1 tetratricopeptide repeat protein [Chloroflexota bacterium]
MCLNLLRRHHSLWELILLVAATPFLLFPSYVALFGLILLSAQTVLRRARTGRWVSVPSSWTMLVIVLLVTAMIGAAIAPDKALSLNRLFVLVLGIAVFYTIAGIIDSARDITKVALVVISLGVGMAGLSLVVTNWSMGVLLKDMSVLPEVPLLWNLPNSGVPKSYEGVNPRLIGGAMAFFLPLSLSMVLWGQGKRLQTFAGLVSLVVALPLALSQTPQAYLGFGLALAVIVAWRFPRSLLLEIPVALVVIITWWRWRWWLSEALVDRLELGIAARFPIWSKAWLMIRDMPFTGSGLNNFPVMDGLYSPIPSQQVSAHNVFLQTAVDQGIFGLIAFITLFALAIVAGWRAYHRTTNRNARAVFLGCVGGCIAFLGFGLWDVISLGHKPAPVLWAMLGILAAGERLTATEGLTRRGKARAAKVLVPLAVAVFLLSPLWASALLVNVARAAWHQAMVHPAAALPIPLAQAENLSQQAAALYPGNGRAYTMLGFLANERGDRATAVTYWQRTLNLDPTDFSAHFQLAEAYRAAGQVDLALPHWYQAGGLELLYWQGREAARENEFALAEACFATIMQNDPAYKEAWWYLARMQIRHEKWELARQTYETRIYLFPDDVRPYEGLADLLYYHLDNPVLALQVIEQGFVHAQTKSPQLYFLRSRITADGEGYAAAEPDAKSAVTLLPTSDEYATWLAELYFKQGRYQEALAQYDHIIANTTNQDMVWRTYQRQSRVYVSQKNWLLAISAYEAAIPLSHAQDAAPTAVATLYASLGNALFQNGDLARARWAANEALVYDPDNNTATQLLAKLESG